MGWNWQRCGWLAIVAAMVVSGWACASQGPTIAPGALAQFPETPGTSYAQTVNRVGSGGGTALGAIMLTNEGIYVVPLLIGLEMNRAIVFCSIAEAAQSGGYPDMVRMGRQEVLRALNSLNAMLQRAQWTTAANRSSRLIGMMQRGELENLQGLKTQINGLQQQLLDTLREQADSEDEKNTALEYYVLGMYAADELVCSDLGFPILGPERLDDENRKLHDFFKDDETAAGLLNGLRAYHSRDQYSEADRKRISEMVNALIDWAENPTERPATQPSGNSNSAF